MDATAAGTSSSGGGIRSKVAALTETVSESAATLLRLSAEVEQLQEAQHRQADQVRESDARLTSTITREIMQLKDDMDHKWGLQVAENKRLQHHVSYIDLLATYADERTALNALRPHRFKR